MIALCRRGVAFRLGIVGFCSLFAAGEPIGDDRLVFGGISVRRRDPQDLVRVGKAQLKLLFVKFWSFGRGLDLCHQRIDAVAAFESLGLDVLGDLRFGIDRKTPVRVKVLPHFVDPGEGTVKVAGIELCLGLFEDAAAAFLFGFVLTGPILVTLELGFAGRRQFEIGPHLRGQAECLFEVLGLVGQTHGPEGLLDGGVVLAPFVIDLLVEIGDRFVQRVRAFCCIQS